MDRIDFTPWRPVPRGGRHTRWTSAEEAIGAIPDGARVFIAGDVMTPNHLIAAIGAAADRWTRLEIVLPGMGRRIPLVRRAGRPFHFITTQAGTMYGELWGTGLVDVLPCRLSDHQQLCTPDGPLPCDVAVVQVSPPGPEGMVSLGMSVGVPLAVTLTAPLVIAQVNPAVPYVFGAGEIPVEEFDFLVEADEPFRDRDRPAELDPTSAAIAGLAAATVPDGATIQFGNGVMPDAILRGLVGRKGLRVHSGLVSEVCVDLFEAGVIEGPMIATQMVNSPRMRAFAHRNPAVQLGPVLYTHGAGVLGTLHRFTALLGAIEVALDGSVNSEVRGHEIISGPGGAPDFAFGAALATGGRVVVGLPSTAGGGTVSRIVATIDPPRPTSLPAYLADLIVTEHGVAEVRGLPLRARAGAISAIADPRHRAVLAAHQPLS
ncbi:MAG: acetyl-CoA hydrolase/transferase family protein [Acidimicrobiales bacterium]